MTENKAIYEKFQMLLNAERRIVVSQLGTPDFSLQSFVAYHRNDLWMVLFFQEERNQNELHSLLKAVCFFDKDLKHLWSTGIHLLSSNIAQSEHPVLIDEFIEAYGTPHAEMGGGKSALIYLMDDGYILFAKYQDDAVLEVSKASLNELAKKSK